MRALVCEAYGPIESLKIRELPEPEPAAGEVLIRVGAAGVSFAAMLGVQGKHQNKPPLPYVPGNELAGHIVKLGPDVKGLAVGQRVTTGVSHGAFAEYAVATAANVLAIPETMPYAQATNFPTLYPTAYGALKWKADLQPGEVLLVHGAGGGSGLTAIEVGKAMGAIVIASAGGTDKLEAAREHGADHVIDYRTHDLRAEVLALTDGRGADVVYDPVGGSAFDISLRCVAPEGRLIPMGFASGTIPQIPANILLVKNVTVIGFYYGYYTGWGGKGAPSPKEVESLGRRRAMVAAAQKELMHWFTEDRLRATIAGTFDLADWVQGFELIQQRKVVGKAVLVP